MLSVSCWISDGSSVCPRDIAWEMSSWADRLVRSLAMTGTRITAARKEKKIKGTKISASMSGSSEGRALAPLPTQMQAGAVLDAGVFAPEKGSDARET